MHQHYYSLLIIKLLDQESFNKSNDYSMLEAIDRYDLLMQHRLPQGPPLCSKITVDLYTGFFWILPGNAENTNAAVGGSFMLSI